MFAEDLGDVSWLGEIRRGGRAGRKAAPVRVRVIDYSVDNGIPDAGTDEDSGGFRLITTVLDPADIDAADLAVAYWERWEIESVFDELKTHQRDARCVLRSKSPGLHHHITKSCEPCCVATTPSGRSWPTSPLRPAGTLTGSRLLLYSESPVTPPDRAAFPPERHVARLWRTAVTLLARRLNPERRARSLPRVVKRKYTKWHVKRAAHADWPQPTHLPEITLTLVS